MVLFEREWDSGGIIILEDLHIHKINLKDTTYLSNNSLQARLKDSLRLFLFFFKIGFFTFGGGWSILAQMEEEFINRTHEITKEDLLDMTSVGKSMPGIMIANISMIFGYRMAGIVGAFAATLGMILPSIIILTLVTMLYNYIKDNVFVKYAMSGIRSAVIPIIASSALSLWSAAITDKACLVFCLVAFYLSGFTGIGNIRIVLIGILYACLLTFVRRKR